MTTVSVFIRARNEAAGLARTLEALQQQARAPDEVVVLDNESEDDTAEVARQFGARVENMSREDFTYGGALNRALAVTQGDVIVFLSAHSPPVDDFWLARLVEPIEAGRTQVTFGRQVPEPNVNRLEEWIVLRTFPRRPGPLKRWLGLQKITFSNANSAVRRDLLERHRFREDLTFAEDIEWSRRIARDGHQPLYCPDAAIFHSHFFAPGDLQRRMELVGRAMRQSNSAGVYRSRPARAAIRLAAMTVDFFYCVCRGYWSTIPSIYAYRREYFHGLRDGIRSSS